MTANLKIVRTREEWAAIINDNWRKSLNGIVGIGDMLNEASTSMSPADFKAMCGDDLIFSEPVTRALMKIAKHPSIRTTSRAADLPIKGWTIFAELANLSEKDFAAAQNAGLITSETSRGGARAIADAYDAEPGDRIGDENSPRPDMRPSPKEARKIANATNTLILASDNHWYSGATKEEGEAASERVNLVYGIRDAVKEITETGLSPAEFLNVAESWQLWKPEDQHEIVDAIVWLTGLRNELGV